MMSKGMSTLIPKSMPHYFVSNTDSIVAEWGATPDEKKVKCPEFRKLIGTQCKTQKKLNSIWVVEKDI